MLHLISKKVEPVTARMDQVTNMIVVRFNIWQDARGCRMEHER